MQQSEGNEHTGCISSRVDIVTSWKHFQDNWNFLSSLKWTLSLTLHLSVIDPLDSHIAADIFFRGAAVPSESVASLTPDPAQLSQDSLCKPFPGSWIIMTAARRESTTAAQWSLRHRASEEPESGALSTDYTQGRRLVSQHSFKDTVSVYSYAFSQNMKPT